MFGFTWVDPPAKSSPGREGASAGTSSRPESIGSGDVSAEKGASLSGDRPENETRKETMRELSGRLLREHAEARNLTMMEVLRDAEISYGNGYLAFCGERELERDEALAMAFGLKLDSKEAFEFMVATHNNDRGGITRRDVAIAYYLDHGFTVKRADAHLVMIGEKPMRPYGRWGRRG